MAQSSPERGPGDPRMSQGLLLCFPSQQHRVGAHTGGVKLKLLFAKSLRDPEIHVQL